MFELQFKVKSSILMVKQICIKKHLPGISFIDTMLTMPMQACNAPIERKGK